ncbi:hypothetical protein HN031_19970 [Nocardioides sp. zg-1308]|uniref:hypothetical protein n=1 Tax=Nocardioides sp. zg-1308 TaxID=2736253 RepID=UPI001555C4C4|nr:hypothetical protein [Nocardioides sp. zg-1308]NPD06958.1 hypothetical protein [Nocardioides sp. zg-1308]
MQLSKLGQGLAVSAVSALVITGLAVSAAPASAAETTRPLLLSQADGLASVRLDRDTFAGGARSVTLTAQRVDPGATVSFEYNADPAAGDSTAGWTPVPSSTSTVQGAYVSFDWQPEPALVGTSVAVRAVETTAATDDAPATVTSSVPRTVAISGDGSPVDAVSVGAPGIGFSTLGPFFAQPYADSGRTGRLLAVSGTTSATDGVVELSAWNPAVGAFRGQVDAAVSPAPLKVSFDPTGGFVTVDGGRFTGVLDIAGFDAADGDALAVRAERGSDTVQPALLQAQTITSVTASADPVAGPERTTVGITVLDQGQRAVVGAEVRRTSDGGLVGYTDALGLVTAEQPNSSTETYYANTTDADGFDEGVDVATEVVATSAYVPVLEGVEAVLADGAVFDDREHAPGDIALQLVDGAGKPFGSEEQITYALQPSGQQSATPVEATTDAAGRLVVPFDAAGPDGAYTLAFSTPGSPADAAPELVTFVAGDAVLGLTPVAGTAPSGGRITYTGSLTVEGQPLPGRAIDLGYTRGTEQAPGTQADAGLVVGDGRALEGSLATADDGTFSVVLADPAEAGNPAETGGRLRVTARGLGDSIDATADFTAAAPVTPVTPPVGTDPVKGSVSLRLTGSGSDTGADRLRVTGPATAAGERIRVHARVADGHWLVVRTLRLDRKGDASLTVRDRNGNRVTRYRVRLLPNARFTAFTSDTFRAR